MEVVGEDGEVTFDKINQLKLMDKLINESLRISNPIPEHERKMDFQNQSICYCSKGI